MVEAIPDPTAEEKATDRFRPRYAVDVQPLGAQGQPDGPVLEGPPLPASSVLHFPNIGERVGLGYSSAGKYNGDPHRWPRRSGNLFRLRRGAAGPLAVFLKRSGQGEGEDGK